MKMIVKYLKAWLLPCVVAAVALLPAACGSFIYDEEGDCSVNYRIKFVYNKNLKWADAFANEVRSVRLYAFGEDNILVAQYSVQGARLEDPDFTIDVSNLDPGRYHLLAWCGLDNPRATAQHFYVPEAKEGITTLKELTCRLNRTTDASGVAVSDKCLEFMFHGDLDVELPKDDDGGEYTYTMPLTKDTNHLRIILQHLSGEDLDVNQFSFRLEDANGFYAHDNSLLDDEVITYNAYSTSSGVAAVVRPDAPETSGAPAAGVAGSFAAADGQSRALVNARTAIADISLGRMMADRARDMYLIITNGEGVDIAHVPVIDYALLSKDFYINDYGHADLTDQDYLDREDEYAMTFFIDEDQEWYSAEIFINSWRIVFHNVDL